MLDQTITNRHCVRSNYYNQEMCWFKLLQAGIVLDQTVTNRCCVGSNCYKQALCVAGNDGFVCLVLVAFWEVPLVPPMSTSLCDLL